MSEQEKTPEQQKTPVSAADSPDRPSDAREHVGVQFSLYPLRQEQLKPALQAAVKAAAGAGLPVQVGRLSSVAAADEETAFRAVRAAFRAAREHGPAVMVVTLSTRVPSDQSVTAVQTAAEGQGATAER